MLCNQLFGSSRNININPGFGIGFLNLLASSGKNAAIFLLFDQPPLEVPRKPKGDGYQHSHKIIYFFLSRNLGR